VKYLYIFRFFVKPVPVILNSEDIKLGKSNIKANLDKIKDAGFDRIVFVATSPTAVSACQRAIEAVEYSDSDTTELLTWLDIS